MHDEKPAPRGKRPTSVDSTDPPPIRRIELREEELVPQKELVEVGEVVLRTTVEHAPGRIEVDAYTEDVEVEHVPLGWVVRERVEPHQEGDVLVVPIYEEELVVVKRLVLREELHVRRVASTERHVFEDTLQRERLIIEDAGQTGRVRELYPDGPDAQPSGDGTRPGFLERVVRRAFE